MMKLLKRIASVMLSTLLLQAAAVPAFSKTNAEKDARRDEKVRAQKDRLGTGKDALVRI